MRVADYRLDYALAVVRVADHVLSSPLQSLSEVFHGFPSSRTTNPRPYIRTLNALLLAGHSTHSTSAGQTYPLDELDVSLVAAANFRIGHMSSVTVTDQRI